MTVLIKNVRNRNQVEFDKGSFDQWCVINKNRFIINIFNFKISPMQFFYKYLCQQIQLYSYL